MKCGFYVEKTSFVQMIVKRLEEFYAEEPTSSLVKLLMCGTQEN
jgi:hypothetical protein